MSRTRTRGLRTYLANAFPEQTYYLNARFHMLFKTLPIFMHEMLRDVDVNVACALCVIIFRVYRVYAIQGTRKSGGGGSHMPQRDPLSRQKGHLSCFRYSNSKSLCHGRRVYMTQRAAYEEGGRGRQKGRGERTTDIACGSVSKTHRSTQYVQSRVSVW